MDCLLLLLLLFKGNRNFWKFFIENIFSIKELIKSYVFGNFNEINYCEN